MGEVMQDRGNPTFQPGAVHESRDAIPRMGGEGLPSLPRVTALLRHPRTPQILPRADKIHSLKLGDIAST